MNDESNFEQEARRETPGLVAEYLEFLRESKKYWMIPILLVILVLGLLVFMGGTGAAPFIYTLF